MTAITMPTDQRMGIAAMNPINMRTTPRMITGALLLLVGVSLPAKFKSKPDVADASGMFYMVRGYKRRMSMVRGPFFKVSCNNPGCQSEFRMPAKVGGSTWTMAARVRDLLTEAGWTKDSQGIVRCPECSASPAPLITEQLEQLGSESEEEETSAR